MKLKAYLRKSPDPFTVNLSIQRFAIESYARYNDAEVTEWYVDDAVADKNFLGPEFERLYHDIEKGDNDFDALVVNDINILSADMLKLQRLEMLLESNHKRLIFVLKERKMSTFEPPVPHNLLKDGGDGGYEPMDPRLFPGHPKILNPGDNSSRQDGGSKIDIRRLRK
jgi:hypothetical protein